MRSIAVLFVFALMTSTTTLLCQATGGDAPQRPAATSTDYTAESVVVEKQETIYRFAADGTGSREIAAVIRIQSDAAARQYGVLNFAFAGNSEHVEIDYVRVRKPDGTVVETPAAEAQEMPQQVTREAPFYSDLKEKQLPVRNLRMGDKLEYKARIVGTMAEAPGQFWGQDSFGTWAVILSQTIELHVPKSKFVKVWSPGHDPAKTESGEETVYRWTASQLEPTTGKDSKLKQKEIDPRSELPTVAWTTFKSWEEVGAWYRSLEGDRATPDAEIKARTTELLNGKTSEEEKARVLYGYVATQIRYIGVAFGVGRYQPHQASEVLRNQYGDCKDKHTLLAAMLTAAGMHPSAALIGAGIRLNEDVPSPSAFNHMITTVPVGGRQVWLDTTAEIAPWEMLVSPTRDKQTLVVPDTGTAKLGKTPQKLPFAPFVRFDGKGTLSQDGTMKAQIEYTTRGDDELLLRTLLRQVPPGQWDELAQRLSQGVGFGGTTSHAEAGRPDLTDAPEKISYDYEREKTGDWDNHRILPLFPVIFLPAIDDKNPPKVQPIQLGEPRVETSLSTIKLPVGWGADLPAAVHQKAAFATFDKTYKIEGDTLTTERKIEVLQREVPAADWKTYKKWYDAAVGEGEPFIALISTATDKTSGATSNASAASLIREAYEQIQRGELNAARATLDKAKNLSEAQRSLWSTYGYLNYERRNWDTAIDDYRKEIALYPDTAWVYRALANAQVNSSHFEDAIQTLHILVRLQDVTDDDLKRSAALLILMKHYDDAITTLESLHARLPEDESVQVQLGTAQIEAGHKVDGEKTLVSLLNKTTQPRLLNNGAFELAKSGVELDLAEKSAQKAIDALTAESKSWKLDATAKDAAEQRSNQALLVAAWDTFGWTLYKEGKITESESYIRAAWLNSQSAETGLHLGEIEEKRGNKQEALDLYSVASASTRKILPNTPSAISDPVRVELDKRSEAMKQQGFAAKTVGLQQLTRVRTLPVGSKQGSNALLEYTFFIQAGKIAEPSKAPSEKEIPDGDAMVRRANVEPWTPHSSSARLIRKGTLNCHSGTCDFVIHPM